MVYAMKELDWWPCQIAIKAKMTQTVPAEAVCCRSIQFVYEDDSANFYYVTIFILNWTLSWNIVGHQRLALAK